MATENWNLDVVHSTVGFWVRHLMVSKVHGSFSKWTGSVSFDEKAPEASKVSAEIDVASIDTKDAGRDGHLRTPDFFDAEKFPKITFKSTKVEKVSDGNYKLTGDLSMHGVTKPVTLDVEYGGRATHPQMGERVGFSAKGHLNRKDWGLSYNQVLDAGGVALGEKVEIAIEIEATKAP
jgi:polyisoprenoid-binding protein YceI